MKILEYASTLVLPIVILIFSLLLLSERTESLKVFTEGAKEGLNNTVTIFPSLLLIVVAVKMLSASGATETLSKLISPLTEKLGVPSSILPLVLIRPFSGSASTATFNQLIAEQGVDSLPAFSAAIIMGSSDTIVYIMGVYFSSVGITKSRYALPCAFLVMFFCIFLSCALAKIFQ